MSPKTLESAKIGVGCLVDAIDNVLEKKTRKHIQYYNVVQKVLNSNRHNKLAYVNIYSGD